MECSGELQNGVMIMMMAGRFIDMVTTDAVGMHTSQLVHDTAIFYKKEFKSKSQSSLQSATDIFFAKFHTKKTKLL